MKEFLYLKNGLQSLQPSTRLAYTLEAPSDFDLRVRVAALVAAVQAGLEKLVVG